jgi:hypothetical protein
MSPVEAECYLGFHYSDKVVKENVRMATGEELEIPGKL